MRPLHRYPAAAAAVLAVLLSLTACGSPDTTHASARRKAAAAERLPVVPAPAPTASVPGRRTEESAGPAPSAGPVLPDSRLVPATGSFTPKEKSYLRGRVPVNMDPAAVLQTGQEACQRVTLTAKHDRDAAVGAVIAGEIPDAKDAISQLCPDQKPVLEAALRGFPDGTEKNPAPARYRALTTDPSCTWRATGRTGKTVATGPATGAKGQVTAEIPTGTAEFVSSGCYAWVPAGG